MQSINNWTNRSIGTLALDIILLKVPHVFTNCKQILHVVVCQLVRHKNSWKSLPENL